MDNSLIVRIVAGVLALVVLAVIIMRRKKQA
jgi:LPXTG-motif cell wall-anchored protein